jgi:hypothetical protein
MRFSKGIQAGILLALCSGLPARGASSCSEAAQTTWLSSCGWALFEVRHAEASQPKGPYEFTGDVLFAAQAKLSDELVDACDKLVADPDCLPSKAAVSLQPLLADPCTRDEHLQWLRSCEDEALALQGRTRADLPATFFPDGGFTNGTYIHPHCFNLKVTVSYSLTVEGEESPSDIIETVSVYVDAPNFG